MPVLQHSSLNEVGFRAYITYLALKRHFTSSYDYHKYNGKVNASYDNFITRKDAYSFQRLGKQKNYEELIISNIAVNPKIWVGQLLEDSSRQIYLEWKKKQDSITQHLKDSLSILDNEFQSNFTVENGQYPHLVDLYLQRKLSLEVFTLLTKLTNSQPYWNEKVVDKVLFPDIMNKVDKYYPFINYSKEKLTKVIKNHFF